MDDDRRRASDRYIDERFNRLHDEIMSLGTLMNNKLDNIIVQTTKTNGTVGKHESRISSLENWRWYIVGGGCGVLFVIEAIAHL